jgi:hypothetical protein
VRQRAKARAGGDPARLKPHAGAGRLPQKSFSIPRGRSTTVLFKSSVYRRKQVPWFVTKRSRDSTIARALLDAPLGPVFFEGRRRSDRSTRNLWILADEVNCDYVYEGIHGSIARFEDVADRTISRQRPLTSYRRRSPSTTTLSTPKSASEENFASVNAAVYMLKNCLALALPLRSFGWVTLDHDTFSERVRRKSASDFLSNAPWIAFATSTSLFSPGVPLATCHSGLPLGSAATGRAGVFISPSCDKGARIPVAVLGLDETFGREREHARDANADRLVGRLRAVERLLEPAGHRFAALRLAEPILVDRCIERVELGELPGVVCVHRCSQPTAAAWTPRAPRAGRRPGRAAVPRAVR